MIRKGAGSLANEDGLVQAETGGHPQAILVRGPEVPGGRWQPPGSPPPITAKLLGHLRYGSASLTCLVTHSAASVVSPQSLVAMRWSVWVQVVVSQSGFGHRSRRLYQDSLDGVPA